MRVYRRGRGFGDFFYSLEFGLNPLFERATFQILVAQSLVQQRDLVCYIFVVASRNIRLLKVHRSSLICLLLKVLKCCLRYSLRYIFRCLLLKVLKCCLRYSYSTGPP